MTSASRRPRRRSLALALGSFALVLGGMAPAATAHAPVSASTALASPVTSAMLPAAKAKKRPARVAKPRLVTGGSRHDNVRISWKWVSGAARYDVQAAPKKSFAKKGRVKAKRSNTRSRPAGGRLELTVPGLKNATTYYVRVRAVAPNGAKGRWSKPRKAWTKVHIPERITAFSAKSGPNPGEVTFRWKNKKRYTAYFMLDLASTTFHPTGKGLPKKGRAHLRIKISGNKKKFVLSAAQAARAGAKAGSGNHLYYRFSAVNKGKAGKLTRLLPNLRGVKIQGPPVASVRGDVKAVIGTFNLASQKADGKRDFKARADDVAKAIMAKKPGIVGLQELSPGNKGDRPTDLLVARIARAKGSYELVRSTPYVKAGTKDAGSQGARILYDTDRYEVQRNASPCADTSQDGDYSSSCTIEMDRAAGEKVGRMAAYAQFLDKDTKARFWFVSVHLTPDSKSKNLDSLRAKQVKTVLKAIDKLNHEGLPVIFTGDLNSWQTRATGNVAQDALLGAGFVDTFSTATTVNEDYSTLNNWATSMRQYPQGFGVRLDYVLVKDGVGATRWENVMKAKDSARPSDHNLVVTEVLLPGPR